jgi:hypothetical protein
MSKQNGFDFGNTKTASQYNSDMDALLTGRASISGLTAKVAERAPVKLAQEPEREGKVANRIRTADEMARGITPAEAPVKSASEKKAFLPALAPLAESIIPMVVGQVAASKTTELMQNRKKKQEAVKESSASPVKMASGSDDLIDHLIASAEGDQDLQNVYKWASQYEEGREILRTSYALGVSAAEMEIQQGAAE